MKNIKLTISILPGTFTIYRLSPQDVPPSSLFKQSFYSITKTNDELSIVCQENNDLASNRAERNWKVIKVHGPLDFGLTGILAKLSSTLAEQNISIFTISTFDTDYILVKVTVIDKALEALSQFCTIMQ